MNNKTVFMGIILTICAYLSLIRCSETILETPTPEAQQITKPSLKSALINRYVAKTGNDSNPGTMAAPFLTIQKAADIANPGDTVIVDDGEYSVSGDMLALITRGGVSGSPITFKSKNKWGAILDGKNISRYGIVFYSGASYVNIVNFEIRNFIAGIWSNHTEYPSCYIVIEGNKIHDIGRNETGGGAMYIGYRHNHWTINRNLMYNLGSTSETVWLNKDHAIYIATANVVTDASHDINITNNIMFGISGPALNIGSNNTLIANNVIAWSNSNSQGGSNFITTEGTGGSNLTIANNQFYQPPTGTAYVILSYTGYTGWSVKNNMVYGGRMWESGTYGAGNVSAMAGGNYGRTDCEKSEVDPKFVSAIKANVPNVDFSLQSGSPAIKSGIDVGLTTDFLKNAIIGVPDIGAIEYTLGQVSPPPTVYYNVQTSATTTKSDCGTGYSGSTVTYTVAAGKYSSTVSQADADSKASADLSANKQAYANANGTCTAIPTTVYYNTPVSAATTKNDCGTGYTGSTVTYMVAAGKYTSTISQSDVDSKAAADLSANKQAYANANGTCTAIPVYYNVQQSGTATKNDCGTGYTGSTVTYVVPANKYSSTVSQADADNKAITDVNANKQAYANANGTCIAVQATVYYNAQQSGTATKNDCGSGYTGTTVTYIVPANKYSSTISQTDANNKAIADVTANKQAYANANGTCTATTVSVTTIKKSRTWWWRH